MFASVSSVGRTRAVDYLSLRRHCAVSAKVAATAATAVAASLAQENTHRHTHRHTQAEAPSPRFGTHKTKIALALKRCRFVQVKRALRAEKKKRLKDGKTTGSVGYGLNRMCCLVSK